LPWGLSCHLPGLPSFSLVCLIPLGWLSHLWSALLRCVSVGERKKYKDCGVFLFYPVEFVCVRSTSSSTTGVSVSNSPSGATPWSQNRSCRVRARQSRLGNILVVFCVLLILHYRLDVFRSVSQGVAFVFLVANCSGGPCGGSDRGLSESLVFTILKKDHPLPMQWATSRLMSRSKYTSDVRGGDRFVPGRSFRRDAQCSTCTFWSIGLVPMDQIVKNSSTHHPINGYGINLIK